MNLVGLYNKVYEKPFTVRLLRLFSHFCEVLFATALVVSLYKAYLVSLKFAVLIAALSLISFIIVSLLRRFVRAPRPADIFPALEFLKGSKESPAFPSRHVFSAALIGVVTLYFAPLLGSLLIFISVLLAICRVLLGRHFPRDVIAGFFLGALAGALALIFSYNIIAV